MDDVKHLTDARCREIGQGSTTLSDEELHLSQCDICLQKCKDEVRLQMTYSVGKQPNPVSAVSP